MADARPRLTPQDNKDLAARHAQSTANRSRTTDSRRVPAGRFRERRDLDFAWRLGFRQGGMGKFSRAAKGERNKETLVEGSGVSRYLKAGVEEPESCGNLRSDKATHSILIRRN
jgi:hypothetical protein